MSVSRCDSPHEARVDAVLAAALDAVITIDERGRVVEWNPAAERIFGYARSDALGRLVAELVIPKRLRPAHRAGLSRVLAGGQPRILGRRGEHTAMRADGEELPVELTVTRTAESPVRFTAWIRDLSERRAVEAESKRRRDLFELGERLAQIGSSVRDLRTLAGEWSDGMYRIHGLEARAIAPPIDHVLAGAHPEDRERLAALVWSVIERPEQVPAEGLTADYRTICPDGSIRAVRVRGRVELDERGSPARWVGAAQDVTGERLTECELHAHHAVSQALSDWACFEEGAVDLLRRVGTALDYPFGALWMWDEKQERLASRAFWSAPGLDAGEFGVASREVTFSPGHGIPGRAWATGQPEVFEDVRDALARARRDAAARLGVRSAIAFPAVGEDGPLAVLSFYSLDRRAPGERMVRTLTGIGSELGRFLARRRAELGPRRLSQRELEVLRLAAEGNTGPEIAERLIVSPGTVKTHFENIYDKLGVGDRAAAVAHALRAGLIL